MSNISDVTLIRLPQHLVAEIEALGEGQSVERVVEQAVQTYVDIWHRQHQAVQLAQDYSDLASLYAELSHELADEVWLSCENEALNLDEHKAMQ